MSKKMEPCCARLQTRLTQVGNEIRSVAKIAAARDAKNRDISKQLEQIAELKEERTKAEAAIADHDSEHAGPPRIDFDALAREPRGFA